MINSSMLNGLSTSDAKIKIINEVEKNKIGKKISYRLRDGVFLDNGIGDAQFQLFTIKKEKSMFLDKSELPVKLPEDVDFNQPGNPWISTKLEIYKNSKGEEFIRETDTLDTFVDSFGIF